MGGILQEEFCGRAVCANTAPASGATADTAMQCDQNLPKKKRDRSLASFPTTNDETGRLAHKLWLFLQERVLTLMKLLHTLAT